MNEIYDVVFETS